MELHQPLVIRAAGAPVVAEAAASITLRNRAAEAMFGHSRHDAVGADLDLISPERLRERHSQDHEQVVAGGESQYVGPKLAVPAVRAADTRISIELTEALLHDEASGLDGSGADVRDVTKEPGQHALAPSVARADAELANLRR